MSVRRVRKYRIINTLIRESVDLRKYKSELKKAYETLNKDLEVKVFQDHYSVYGKLTIGDAKKVGRIICNNEELAAFRIQYKNCTKLFYCYKKGKVKKAN